MQVEEAFSYIQTVLALFDYYASPDVASRHGQAFQSVKRVMSDFEDAYKYTPGGRNIDGLMSTYWIAYMQRHFARVAAFARFWVLDRLAAIEVVWTNVMNSHAGPNGNQAEYLFAFRIVYFCNVYTAQINAGTKIQFDDSIFY